jgi:hypothetical protein
MATFKPKSVRPSSDELLQTVGRLSAASGQFPTTPDRITQTPEHPPVHPRRLKAEPTVLVNFKATRPFAKLISELAEREGGVRRMLARMLKEAGHDVPEGDLRPPVNKRVYE